MSAPRQIDIVIAGGGLVGASLACALAPVLRSGGRRLLLIEAFGLQSDEAAASSPAFDARSTALAFGSRRIYEQLGLWSGIAAQATPISRIHVSDKGRFGSTRLDASAHNVEALGYVVENQMLGQSLYERLREESDVVEILAPAIVRQVSREPGGHRLSVEQQGQLQDVHASLLVIADGGRSDLCEQLRIERVHTDYEQHAIIANVQTAKPHDNIAYERFTPDGPLALLPLLQSGPHGGHRMAMVMTVAQADAAEIEGLDDAAMLALVQERFGYRLGQFTRIGERFSYPLALQEATEQLRPGLVVIGNAARTLHPVAGQGFNLALRGVMNLTETLQLAVARELSFGDLATLQPYLEAQAQDQNETVSFTDHTLRMFSNNDLLLGVARDLGLLVLDLVPAAKGLFARRAMGLRSSPLVER